MRSTGGTSNPAFAADPPSRGRWPGRLGGVCLSFGGLQVTGNNNKLALTPPPIDRRVRGRPRQLPPAKVKGGFCKAALPALAVVAGVALLACQQAARPPATGGTGAGGNGGSPTTPAPTPPAPDSGAGHEELAPRGGCLVIGAAAARRSGPERLDDPLRAVRLGRAHRRRGRKGERVDWRQRAAVHEHGDRAGLRGRPQRRAVDGWRRSERGRDRAGAHRPGFRRAPRTPSSRSRLPSGAVATLRRPA